MDYKNTKEVSLMIWETNPQFRAKNNEIKVNVKQSVTLGVGDIIYTNNGDMQSCFEVEKIISSRQSSLSDYNYLECSGRWFNRQTATL